MGASACFSTSGGGLSSTEIAWKARIWKYDTTNKLTWPEWKCDDIHVKKNVGLALSGGGMRSCAASVGWLAALNKLNIISKLKYLSSISGGSWTAVPLTFSTTSVDEFLGGIDSIISPEECTIHKIENWNNVKGSHALALKNSNFILSAVAEFVDNLPKSLAGEHQVDWWSEACGTSFIAPHGIKCAVNSSLPCLYGNDMHHIQNKLQYLGFKDVIYYSTRPMNSHPYPIINGSVLVGGDRQVIPVEFTPLYYGCPVSSNQGCAKSVQSVLVEPHAFSSVISSDVLKMTESGEYITIENPRNILSLHELVGISSANLAQEKGDELSDKAYNLANFPEFEYCGNGIQKFVDGGATDNTGILALLRRDVRNIIACLSCNNSVSESNDVIADPNLSSMGTLAGLFGRAVCKDPVNLVNQEWYNAQRQVFPTEAWDELLAALREKLAAGLPLSHKMTIPVLPNDLINVGGGYTATVLFFIWDECKSWVDRLPAEIKDQMDGDNHRSHIVQEVVVAASASGLVEGNLFRFPFIPLNRLKYSPLLFGLMAQLAAFQIMENSDSVLSLFE